MTAVPENPTTVVPTSRTVDTALVATFAALVAGCALLPAIPVGAVGVPITLQTFGVMLAGAVLGARRGGLAVLLYVVVGLAGLPIFSGGRGGLGVLGGTTVGYIVAFPLAAALAGWLVSHVVRRIRRGWAVPVLIFASCMVTSLLTIHPLGIAGIAWRGDLSLAEAATAGLAYLPGDLLKNLAVGVVAAAVHRAFPDLLVHRARRRGDGP